MHDLEKAAMDDPFLADALEGYNNTTTATTDLDNLKERLDKRVITLAPVVSIKQKRSQWLKVAAAIVVIGGIGLLVQQLAVDNLQKNAIVTTEKEANASSQTAPTTGDLGSFMAISPDSTAAKDKKASNNWSATLSNNNRGTDTLNAAPGSTISQSKNSEGETKKVKIDNSVAAARADDLTEKSEKKSLDRNAADTAKFKDSYDAAVAPQAKVSQRAEANAGLVTTFNNRFNYRVVDAQNKPVPFANVMNTRDNVGTYTDIRGNFNLVSNDSILNVQIKSLGYESNNYKLVPSAQFRSLTLKEDNYAREKIMDSTRQLVSNNTRKDTAELEEPVVGWGYYNTYVANNIQIPENIRKKNTLTNVELSFDVDKTGQPVNIKVTKSSQCKECDDEAIRLLKEGPKWKKKGKRSKTTISIAVDQK